MDPFDRGWYIRASCRAKFSFLEDTNPTNRTIWSTITIIVLAVILDLLAHSDEHSVSWKDYTSRSTSRCAPLETPTNPFPYSSEKSAQQRQRTRPDHGMSSISKSTYPSLPTSTTARLLVSALLFLPVTAAFYIRIRDATADPHLRDECISVINPAPSNWTIVWLLNILPFISASSAFLLVVWNSVSTQRVVRLGEDPQARKLFWPPALPFAAVVFGVAALVAVVAHFVIVVVKRLRKRLDSFAGGREAQVETAAVDGDVEMQGEVSESLTMKNDWEAGDEDLVDSNGQRPPAYEQLYRGFARLSG